jgi:hypothetical protein
LSSFMSSPQTSHWHQKLLSDVCQSLGVCSCLIRLLVFLLLNYRSSLHILDMGPCQVCQFKIMSLLADLQIFSPIL